MSSLSDKLRPLDVGENIAVDVAEGCGYEFIRTVVKKAAVLSSRVTNSQRLHSDLNGRKFSTRIMPLIDCDGSLYKLVRIERIE